MCDTCANYPLSQLPHAGLKLSPEVASVSFQRHAPTSHCQSVKVGRKDRLSLVVNPAACFVGEIVDLYPHFSMAVSFEGPIYM